MRVFTDNEILRHLHGLSNAKHQLVDSPGSADIILVIFPWIDGCQVESHILADQYPYKCFAISTTQSPQYSVRGVYTTVEGFVSSFGGRIRTGAYTSNNATYKNPFIEGAEPGSGIGHQKDYLFSFIGRNCHPAREALLNNRYKRNDLLLEDSSETFKLWEDERDESRIIAAQERFCDILKRSKFALCPRGTSPNSIRLFESLKLGVVPVVISDNFQFPIGPEWSDFSIQIPEKQIGNLETILGERESDCETMGRLAAKAYQEWFSEQAYFNFLVNSCMDISREQWIPETAAQKMIAASYRLQRVFIGARKKLGIRTRLNKYFARQQP